MDTLTLRVAGMDCAACEKRIAAALGRLDGVREASADHRTGTVQVDLTAQPADRAAIVARIEAAGFTVTADAGEKQR